MLPARLAVTVSWMDLLKKERDKQYHLNVSKYSEHLKEFKKWDHDY